MQGPRHHPNDLPKNTVAFLKARTYSPAAGSKAQSMVELFLPEVTFPLFFLSTRLSICKGSNFGEPLTLALVLETVPFGFSADASNPRSDSVTYHT